MHRTSLIGRRSGHPPLPLAIVLLLGLALGAVAAPAARAAAAVFVRPDGSDSVCNGLADAPAASAPNCAFATIQKGVTTVDTGGTVSVAAGTYVEHINLSKTLTIHGANAGVDARTPTPRGAESIVDGGGTDAAFAVNANNVVIDGFQVQRGQNGLGAGIWVGSATGVQILNSVITDNAIGLYINGGPCIVRHNRFVANNRIGAAGRKAIYTESTNGLTIDANEFSNQSADVPVVFGTATPQTPSHLNVTLTGNSFHDNAALGVYVLGVSGGTFSGNTFIRNASATPTYGDISFEGNDSNVNVVANTFAGDPIGVRVSLRNDGNPYTVNSNINVHFNRFAGTTTNGIRVISHYAGTMNAENNWWRCNAGPGAMGCDTINGNIDANPWLTLRLAAPSPVVVGQAVPLTADLTFNSAGADTSSTGILPNGTPAAFAGTLGVIAPASPTTISGKAQTTYTAGTIPGAGSASVTVDSQTVSAAITVNKADTTTTIISTAPDTSRVGQAVTVRLSVTVDAPGAGTPTGAVTISGGSDVCSASIAAGSCAITLTSTGTITLTAAYAGDGSFNGSSDSTTHQVFASIIYLPVVRN